MKQQIENLIPKTSADEKNELTILYNARLKTMQSYNEDPTAARKKDLDAAKDGIQQLIASLESKYTPTKADKTAAPGIADPADVLFKNSSEMFDYLKDKGWGLSSRQTLTNHAKNGSLMLQPDRSITAKAFEQWKLNDNGGLRYFEAYTKHRREQLGSIEENTLQKSKDEAEITALNRRKKEREEQLELGQLIQRTDADVEICAWAAMVRDALVHRITQALPKIIHASGGQSAALPDAQNLLDQAIDHACNDIADSNGVEVEIEAVEEE